MRKTVLFTLTLAIFTVLNAYAQNGKFYTKKARLEDFSAKVTKVVLSGDAFADAVLREEVALRWQLSPYEFCTVADYESIKNDSQYYFLHFVRKDDVIFLSLDKGGTKDAPDVLKQPMEVVSIPVSGADLQILDNLCYMPAFIDIIQNFTSGAMGSDGKAYAGLTAFNIFNMNGKTAVIQEEEARKSFQNAEPDTMAGIIAAPAKPKVGSWCYKMLISCDTHELCYFKKHKITADQPAGWLRSDRKRIYGISAE